MATTPGKHIMSLVKRFGRLSLKWRITAAILVSFIVVLPSVFMSFFYFTSILDELNAITERDVRLGRFATDLSLTMLEIRRYERNYRMLGGSGERAVIERSISHVDSVLSVADSLATADQRTLINGLHGDLDIYSNSFRMLVEHITENPPQSSGLQKSLIADSIDEFQERYSSLLEELEQSSPAERDSILSLAVKALDDQTLNLLALSAQPGDPTYIIDNLEQSRSGFLQKARTLADISWANMQSHKQSTLVLAARAKRNIVTLLIITAVICILMVSQLPRYIVKPITALNKILRKAGEGDFSAYAVIRSRDEIGDLAKNYNHMLDRLRLYDGLKTRKIASQKRMFDRLMEMVKSPACIITRELDVVFYNTAFNSLFGSVLPPKAPDRGISIESVPALKQFKQHLETQINGGKNNFTFSFETRQRENVVFRGRLVLNGVMKLESVVLVGSVASGGE